MTNKRFHWKQISRKKINYDRSTYGNSAAEVLIVIVVPHSVVPLFQPPDARPVDRLHESSMAVSVVEDGDEKRGGE